MKTILLTGATDGIGFETAKMLVAQGFHLLIHGRNAKKLEQTKAQLIELGAKQIDTYLADLSSFSDTVSMAQNIVKTHRKLDVIINNAGILKTPHEITSDGLDIRFVVNTLTPYVLTQKLLPICENGTRIINLSSAAQAPINEKAIRGKERLPANTAYAQSKLAITMWSIKMAEELKPRGISVVAVNPGSLLASKMVKEGYGIDGEDITIGADILVRAAVSDEFAEASGQYYDNDSKCFANPHSDALASDKVNSVCSVIDQLVRDYT